LSGVYTEVSNHKKRKTMKTAIKKMMTKILNNAVGKKRLQKFFEPLLLLSLRGLNYGNGGDFKESGELNVLKYINDKFNNEKSLIIFDVGGNAGNYSKALYDFFNSKATIHSFEPSKKTYEIFLRPRILNRLFLIILDLVILRIINYSTQTRMVLD
jgi:hypothetical protein